MAPFSHGLPSCHKEPTEPWCATIEALEFDSLSAPEVIATFKKCFPVEQKVAVYELDGTQSDDGWFDAFFELGYNVVHTCRMNGEQFHLLGTLQQFAVWKEFYHEEKIFDLNDNTVHQVHSLCDEPQCDCMVDKKKFYFEAGKKFTPDTSKLSSSLFLVSVHHSLKNCSLFARIISTCRWFHVLSAISRVAHHFFLSKNVIVAEVRESEELWDRGEKKN
ncbi:hypothetical protein L5515_016482 [Caenorhabditis briggsae]|uniref:Uncharacterized protein n=1 Tax=Caenorhabditis briggsae TaxID=6238 RepID=A0AAE9JPF9_CAEBR|nr:hypothetical protein L5515_016482 [Caenorhabditis briggsae]